MKKHFIIGNFGNPSMAVAQWAIEQQLPDTYFLYIDTGWAAQAWHQHSKKCHAYVQSQGIEVVKLDAKQPFQEMVRDRGQFPSQKFQWCAGFLKGLAINEYLDEHDSMIEGVLMFGKRRQDSRANATLNEFVEASEHYDERRLWYPLLDTENDDYQQLLTNTGIKPIVGRSKECEPCIHSQANDFLAMHQQDIERLATLEKELGCVMFPQSIKVTVESSVKNDKQGSLEQFDMGCGSVWGCGE